MSALIATAKVNGLIPALSSPPVLLAARAGTRNETNRGAHHRLRALNLRCADFSQFGSQQHGEGSFIELDSGSRRARHAGSSSEANRLRVSATRSYAPTCGARRRVDWPPNKANALNVASRGQTK